MEALHIEGRRALNGTAAAGGAKNAALPIMAATLLTDEPVILENVPRLRDVDTLGNVLAGLGKGSCWRAADGLGLHNAGSPRHLAPRALVRRMRASFCVLGPLLARRARALIALPGGCRLGSRPVDLHVAGLCALGANIRIARGYVIAGADRLQGAKIHLSGPRGPTVTGTANVMMAACLARGETMLTGAAREPEIVDLAGFLNRLGARIEGAGTGTIRIRGTDQLGGCTYRLMPDRIEAATLLAAGAVTGGNVRVRGVVPEHLEAVLRVLDAAGCELNVAGDSVSIRAQLPLRRFAFTAQPYPGVPTDVQAQLMVLACLARGSSRIADRVFPARFRHVEQLRKLGFVIRRDGAAVQVEGGATLRGGEVSATDLRAGAALVLAGLAAEAETTVFGLDHLDRGYERLDEKLQRLGARIARVRLMNRQDLILGWPGPEDEGAKPGGFPPFARSSPGHPSTASTPASSPGGTPGG